MIFAQAFQNSLHLIEEIPERFNLAVGQFIQRHGAVELLQILVSLGIDDRHCVVPTVIGAIDATRVKLLTNPSDLRLEFPGRWGFLSIPSIGRVNTRNFIGTFFGSAIPGGMLRSVHRAEQCPER